MGRKLQIPLRGSGRAPVTRGRALGERRAAWTAAPTVHRPPAATGCPPAAEPCRAPGWAATAALLWTAPAPPGAEGPLASGRARSGDAGAAAAQRCGRVAGHGSALCCRGGTPRACTDPRALGPCLARRGTAAPRHGPGRLCSAMCSAQLFVWRKALLLYPYRVLFEALITEFHEGCPKVSPPLRAGGSARTVLHSRRVRSPGLGWWGTPGCRTPARSGHLRVRGNTRAPKGSSAAPRPGARPRAAARLASFRPLRCS